MYPVSLARGMHGVLENWLTEIKDTGTTQGMVDRGELRPRSEYNAVIDYDPDRDDRETVLAKLKV